jgi:hypothetical protein
LSVKNKYAAQINATAMQPTKLIPSIVRNDEVHSGNVTQQISLIELPGPSALNGILVVQLPAGKR